VATTVQNIDGDGYIKFTATQTGTSRMFGLFPSSNIFPLSPGHNDLNNAIYPHSSGVLYWSELLIIGTMGAWVSGDVLEVRRVGSVMYYLKNDIVIRTTTALTGQIHGGAGIFEVNGLIENAIIGNL
jgi:hypothetical protein